MQSAGLRSGHRVFEVRDRRLFALGVVGVIDIGQVVVEILPKTKAAASTADRVEFLGNLLMFAGASEFLKVEKAAIAETNGSLLEVVFAWAIRSIEANMSRGMPRRYRERVEASTAVRGRVELRDLVRQRPGKAFELTVRHAPLSERNMINSTLKWLVEEIVRRTRSSRTRFVGRQIAGHLPDIDDVPSFSDVQRLNLTPMESHWSPLIELAKTFLAQGRPDPARGGSLDSVAVLFTLHDLFEAALRRIFAEGFASYGLSLRPGTKHLLRSIVSGDQAFRMRPDFCLSEVGCSSPKIVGDAKWKLIFAERFNLREPDVYQLVAYMAGLQAKAGFVISPLSEDDEQTIRCAQFAVSGLDCPLNVFGVRLGSLIIGDNAATFRRALCERVFREAE
ncbi:hypothetical protein [Agrobacterium sp. fls2-241-TYG-188a]|uniref:McrC family protein n=1 Tax=Agrobacterium sp. fls2-241-TYG-188a TaxID=3040275 RepID=UPI00254DB979|nr:hypothetical protein [Agrobacterium sp. fls2-241-TYG-188a]